MEAGGESDSGDSSATSRAPSVRGLTRAPSVRGLTRGPSIRGLTRAASVRTSGDQDEQAFTPLPSRMSPLAPENTGLTLTNQPVLQWYISDPWPDNIEFRLNRLKAPEPDIDTNIRGTDKGGIYRISLADHNVSLKPGVDYEWVLAIVNDEEERSADFTACARIRYVKPDEELSKRIMNTPKEKLYHVYADQGYWYDALENLSQLIDARPGDNDIVPNCSDRSDWKWRLITIISSSEVLPGDWQIRWSPRQTETSESLITGVSLRQAHGRVIKDGWKSRKKKRSAKIERSGFLHAATPECKN